VIPVGEHAAVAPLSAVTQRGVDVPRRRDQEALHAASERSRVISLDDHVHVRALQRDVYDPEPLAQRRGDRRCAHGLVHRAPPQAAHLRHDPHHDVQRVVRLECLPGRVPLSGAYALWLPSCTAPLAAPPEQLLLDMPLARSLRLRRHARFIITIA
jgi:hypothetical protein